ncbi:MAG: hypothetical protein IJM21_10345 [Clostridia bacterium]|nr:hypothetical protein [Clostridia bacterium]
MKRIPLLLMILLFISALFAGCAGKTPDVIESEKNAKVTLETLDWAIPVEIDGGESTTYTLAQAKAHKIVKIYCSYRFVPRSSNTAPQVTTAIFEGILFSDFLADIGYPDASSVTIYHTNESYYKPFEFDKEILNDPGSIITWIQNKKEVIAESDSYVGFAAANGGVDDMCHSIARIVVHP